jgi:pilus assembly protein CpaB
MNANTMRRLATGIGVVSLLAALIFTIMLVRYRGQQNAGAAESVKVVVPRTAIASSEPLSAGRFEVVEKPKKEVDVENTVHSVDDVEGRYALENLQPGVPLLRKQMGSSADVAAMQQRISWIVPPGYRAMAVPADRLSVINGALRPGDHVDILASGVKNGIGYSSVVLQNVKVLGVGATNLVNAPASAAGQPPGNQPPPADAPEKSTVTLQVTIAQANRLGLAMAEQAQLRLVLRSRADVSLQTVGKITGASTGAAATGGHSRSAGHPSRAPSPGGSRRSGVRWLPPATLYPPLPVAFDPLRQRPPTPQTTREPAGGEHKVVVIRGDAKTTVSFPTSQK